MAFQRFCCICVNGATAWFRNQPSSHICIRFIHLIKRFHQVLLQFRKPRVRSLGTQGSQGRLRRRMCVSRLTMVWLLQSTSLISARSQLVIVIVLALKFVSERILMKLFAKVFEKKMCLLRKQKQNKKRQNKKKTPCLR